MFISENGIKFVRIDGSTLQRERKEAVDSFRLDPEVLPPAPPTHPPTLLLYFPHFSYSICPPKFGLMFIHFILFIFKKVKVAIIGITVGGVGLDFSSAQNVIFVELPKSASELLQVRSLFFSLCLLLQFFFQPLQNAA